MDKEFINKFITSLIYSIISAIFIVGIFVFPFTSDSASPFLWPIVVALLYIPFAFYSFLKEGIKKIHEEEMSKINNEKLEIIKELEDNKALLEVAEHKEEMWKQTLKEKSSGFPTLFEHIELYDKVIDDYVSNQLIQKSHPAPVASQEVREQSKRRREAEKSQRLTQSIIEFYENLQPSLVEYKNEEFGNIDEILRDWTIEEKEDPVSYFLSKEEYRRLSVVEKNQLALERYWKRPHSKWHIGIMYERYVGYLYEMKGYDVNYHGIEQGKSDLGRDVIAQKDNEYIVIQCKYWSQFRKIFENAIFQFFGTVFQYRHANKSKKVKGVFYSTTTVSELAKSFAKELGIELKENFKMDRNYPCIKCNISKVDRTKIYHLPFDQQYDNVKIEKSKGEFYCTTVKEAENKGFRRAWRWKGGVK